MILYFHFTFILEHVLYVLYWTSLPLWQHNFSLGINNVTSVFLSISAALTLSKFAISQLAMLASTLLFLRHYYGILSVGEAVQVFQSLEWQEYLAQSAGVCDSEVLAHDFVEFVHAALPLQLISPDKCTTKWLINSIVVQHVQLLSRCVALYQRKEEYIVVFQFFTFCFYLDIISALSFAA